MAALLLGVGLTLLAGILLVVSKWRPSKWRLSKLGTAAVSTPRTLKMGVAMGPLSSRSRRLSFWPVS
jgi:hypothetical protein